MIFITLNVLIELLQVATIKSPYVMRLGAIKNTRFVTMTKSYTRRVTATEAAVLPTSVLSSANDVEFTLAPRAAVERSDEPFTPTDELPLAENILATTTPIESIFKDSSDTATLPVLLHFIHLIYQFYVSWFSR